MQTASATPSMLFLNRTKLSHALASKALTHFLVGASVNEIFSRRAIHSIETMMACSSGVGPVYVMPCRLGSRTCISRISMVG